MSAILDFIATALAGYAILCAICCVIFGCVVAVDWYADKLEKEKQDESMEDILNDEF